MDEMKCEWSGVKNVARTGIPFIKLDRISVLYAVGLFATFENISFTALQSRTGKYRGLRGNPCIENRIPAMRTAVMKTVRID